MPKIFITIIFTVLILGITIGGGILLWQNYLSDNNDSENKQADSENNSNSFPYTRSENKDPEEQPLPPDGDADNDGLSNSDEIAWNTDPENPDTDGDGYLDGEEVAAGHDPTIPAPDDLLDKSTTSAPQENTNRPTDTATGGLSLGNTQQYFSENLDLKKENRNFTEEYKQEYPEEERYPASRREYADQQPIITLLPEPSEEDMPDLKEDSPYLLEQYLSFTNNENILGNSGGYSQAEYDLYSKNNPNGMLGLAQSIKDYRERLVNEAVPQTALPVHKMLLGYTELLAATFEQIALWNEDPVKSLVATRQLEVIDRKYYPIIYSELQRLEAMQ